MRSRTAVPLLALGILGAVALGASFVRAGLVTDFVGVEPDYVLEGPADVACVARTGVDREIGVTWRDRDDAESGFVVSRQGPLINGTSTANFQLPASAGAGGTVAFTDTSVVPDASYTYTVRSFLGPALSPATSTSEGCTTVSVPPQPDEVRVEGIGLHGVSISWRNNATNHQGFRIYRFSSEDSRDSAAFEEGGAHVQWVIHAPANATSYPDYGTEILDPVNPYLLSNTTYCYYVEAYNERGPELGPPGGAPLACGDTWSQQPRVMNLEVGEGARPTTTWVFQDDDPLPGGGGPQQTKVQVQVCAAEFSGTDGSDDDCYGENWYWNASTTLTTQELPYLYGYPLDGARHQHPLDFDELKTYYLRLRVWDDTDTPSEWATANFTVLPPTAAIVNDFTSPEGLVLSGATHYSGFGGEVVLVGPGAKVGGTIGLSNVVSVRLLQSASPGLKWYVRRSTVPAESWQLIGGDGTLPAVWDDHADGLEWEARVVSTDQSAQVVLGGVAFAVNANHAPVVTDCSAIRFVGDVDEDGDGGEGQELDFRVSVSDPDPDFDYDLTRVKFDWRGGLGLNPRNPNPEGWEEFDPSAGPLTVFKASWPVQGNFTPMVRARDQYGDESAAVSCDTVTVGPTTPAWLRTQDADVFSGGSIYSSSPAGQPNATYLVQATGQIQEFTTAALNCRREAGVPCEPSDAQNSNYRQIALPEPNGSQPLGTVLGSVDIGGILAGRYGTVTPTPEGASINLSAFFNALPTSPMTTEARVLNGAIYHVRGNATVDATTTIGNAGDSQSGAGLIIVDGDLYINAPITYDLHPVQISLRRLASLGWLVKGNVYIRPSVGAVAFGNANLPCTWSTPEEYLACTPAVAGTFYLYDRGNGSDGIFFTGSGGELSDQPLQVGGLVVAQRFALQRNRPDEVVPSELFRYDGRVFANPPPGLQDFAKALPRWRPLAPLP